MKMKGKYLLVVGAMGLIMASCTKEQIGPITDPANDAPSWNEETSRTMTGTSTAEEGVEGGGTDNGLTGTTGDITDPNSDPDGNKKGKGSK